MVRLQTSAVYKCIFIPRLEYLYMEMHVTCLLVFSTQQISIFWHVESMVCWIKGLFYHKDEMYPYVFCLSSCSAIYTHIIPALIHARTYKSVLLQTPTQGRKQGSELTVGLKTLNKLSEICVQMTEDV